MVTKKIHQKKTDGTVVEVDLGCDGKNVTQDVTHRFVSDTEKSTWNNKAPKTAFTGATASAAGAMGLVPVPAAGKQKAYLRGDGTWENADDHTATFTQASARTNIVSGEKLSVIFGKIAKVIADLISHLSNTSNPHSVTKAQVGLGNADNTSDANKPVSAAQQAAIDAAYANSNYYTDEKIAALINGAPTTLDTLGEIAEAMEENASVVDALEAAIGERAKESEFTSHVNNTSNPHNVTKEQVGLGNVPNVSTNNQTPTYTAASALGELQSGEKLSVAFGKIKLAVTNVINIVKLLGTTDISALGNGTVTGAISDFNSRLQSEIDKTGQIEYIFLNQSLGETSNSAPWLELKAQYDSFVNHKLYIGRINCGSQAVFIGMRTSDTYGTFLVQLYSNLYHVHIAGGIWRYQNLKLPFAPNYKAAITPLSTDITSGTWEYTAPSDGLLIFDVTITAVTVVSFGIKGTGVNVFYEQNYASKPARMTRIIPMAEGDVFNVTDCVHANVHATTEFVPYRDNNVILQ